MFGVPATGVPATAVAEDEASTAERPSISVFYIDDAAPEQLQRTFVSIQTGAYTVAQTAVPSWTLTEIACSEEMVTDVTTGTVTIDLRSNQALACTFVNADEQPDAGIAQSSLGPFKADGTYSATVLESQTAKRRNAKRRGVYDFFVMIQNDGGRTDSFSVRGRSSGSTRIQLAFLDPSFARANGSAKTTVDLTVTSMRDPARVDVVRAVTRR